MRNAIRAPSKLLPKLSRSFCFVSTTSCTRFSYVNDRPDKECMTAVLCGSCRVSASNIGKRGRVCAIRMAALLLSTQEAETVCRALRTDTRRVERRCICVGRELNREKCDGHKLMDPPGSAVRNGDLMGVSQRIRVKESWSGALQEVGD